MSKGDPEDQDLFARAERAVLGEEGGPSSSEQEDEEEGDGFDPFARADSMVREGLPEGEAPEPPDAEPDEDEGPPVGGRLGLGIQAAQEDPDLRSFNTMLEAIASGKDLGELDFGRHGPSLGEAAREAGEFVSAPFRELVTDPLETTEDVARQTGRSLTDFGTDVGAGVLRLANLGVEPALKAVGAPEPEALEESADFLQRRSRETERTLGEPETAAGRTTGILSRLGLEGLALAAGGQAVGFPKGAGALRRVGQGVKAFGPIDAVIGASGEGGAPAVLEMAGQEEVARTLREHPILGAAAEVVLGAGADMAIEGARTVRGADELAQLSDEELIRVGEEAARRGDDALAERAGREVERRQGQQVARPEEAEDVVPMREPVRGPTGTENVVRMADDTKVRSEYRVVEADELTPSHNPFGFTRNPEYPRDIQDRLYHANDKAKAEVVDTAENLDPEVVLDRTVAPSSGPPIIRADGITLSGNQRAMAIKRAYDQVEDRANAYREELVNRADELGLDPERVRSMDRPVLVRQVTDERVNLADRDQMADLAARFNEDPQKAKTPAADAATRSRRLKQAGDALRFFEDNIEPDQTIRSFLDTGNGRDFMRELVDDGVISRQKAAQFIDRGGNVTGQGKEMVERMMRAALVDDPNALIRAEDEVPSALKKLEHATVPIVSTTRVGAYNISPLVRDAVDALASWKNSDIDNLNKFLNQRDLLGDEFTAAEKRMAEFLWNANKREVTESFRTYADRTDFALRQAENADMFGVTGPSPREAFNEAFDTDLPEGVSLRAEPATPQEAAGRGGAIRALDVQDDLFGRKPEVTGEPQREMFENPGGLSDAEARARATVSQLESKVRAGDATPEEESRYREALALLRRGEAQSAEETSLRAEGEEIEPGETGELFELSPGGDAASPMDNGWATQRFRSEMLPDVAERAEAETGRRLTLAEIEEAPPRSEVIRDLSEALQTPIREGKHRFGEAMGVTKMRPQAIRLKWMNDMEVVSHEAGHRLSQLMWPEQAGSTPNLGAVPESTFAPWSDELERLAEGISDESLNEGFAEYVRRFLTNPDIAREAAPNFHRMFVSRLDQESPGVLRALQDASERYRQWLQADPESRVEAHIARDERPQWSELSRWQQLRKKTIDDLVPVEQAVQDIFGAEGPETITEDAYKLARLWRGAGTGAAETFLERGQLNFRTREVVGPSLRDILSELDSMREARELERYMVSQRALELALREQLHEQELSILDLSLDEIAERVRALDEPAVQTGIDPEDALQVVRRHDSSEFTRLATEIRGYTESLLEYLRDAGVMSDETVQTMVEQNEWYVPFYRAQEEEAAGGVGGSTFSHIWNPVKRIQGSGRDILPPFESIVKNTATFARLAHKQRVSNALAEMAREYGAGQWIERVDNPVRPVRVGGDEIAGQLRDAMPDDLAEEMEDKVIDRMAEELFMTFRPGDYFNENNMISVLEDGQRRWYQVHPAVYDALEGTSSPELGMIQKMFRGAKRMVRVGATLTVGFAQRNLLRDNIMAFVQSEYGFKPFLDPLKGAAHLLRKDDLYWKWKASGGEFAAITDLDREALRQSVEGFIEDGGRLRNVVRHPLESLEALSSAAENLSRVAEFENAMRTLEERGVTGTEAYDRAAYAAREVTIDFARRGAGMGWVHSYVPFYNAMLQGYSRVIRAAKKNPKQFTAKALAGITVPAIMEYAINREDPDWWALPRWQRDLFFNIKLPNQEWLTIPKPFEPGLVFATLPQRMLEWMETRDPTGLRRTLEDFAVRRMLQFEPIHQIALTKPLIENVTNYSFFLQRDLVPPSMQGVEEEYQAAGETTTAAKELGKFLDMSPEKIENMMFGYTASLGRATVKTAESGLEAAGVIDKPAEPGGSFLSQAPLVSGLVRRAPRLNSSNVSRFYDAWEQARSAHRTLNLLERQNRPDEARAFREDHRQELRAYERLQDVSDELSKLRGRAEIIYRDEQMDEDEKDRRLQRIGRHMDRLARQAINRRIPGE